MKRARTREPLTILMKFDRIQVVQVMEDMLNVVASGTEEKNDLENKYDDKTEVRKVMSYLLDQVVHIKPKRIRKPKIKKPTLLPEFVMQEPPAGEEYPPFVPRTLEGIQRDGWDFNNFVLSLPLLVTRKEIEREAVKVNVYSKERTNNFNRQTDITSLDYNPNFEHLPYYGLKDPSQLLWQQMFGMTPGPFGNSNQPSTSTSLSSLSQVPCNQLQGEPQKIEDSPPRKCARSSKVVRIHDSDKNSSSTPVDPLIILNEGRSNSEILAPGNVVLE